MFLEQRMQAKANKDWATSDKIRDELAALGFEVKEKTDYLETEQVRIFKKECPNVDDAVILPIGARFDSLF